MKPSLTCIILFVLLSFSIHGFSQGKIDQSKKEIQQGNTSSSSQPPASTPASSNNSSHYRSVEEQTLGEIISNAVTNAVLYLTVYTAVGNYEKEGHLKNKLTPFPYYNTFSGNYEAVDTNRISKNQFRVDLNYQFLYSSKHLTGHQFNINIHPFQYFYLQAQYRELRETNFDSSSSNLSLFNFNFCYDRLRFERFNLGWKIGASYIGNNINKAGFSFGVDAEAFICKPISIYVSRQWSTINHVPINSFDVMGKFHKNRYHFQLGYEHLKIGSPLYNYISLGIGVTL
jgi:hypothetical protein